MAQPAVMGTNGSQALDSPDPSQPVAPGKRKRDSSDDGEGVDADADHDEEPTAPDESSPPPAPARDERELVQSCFEALKSLDIEPPILKRTLPETASEDEPDAKRQKSADPPSSRSIADKVAAGVYDRLGDMSADVASAVKAALNDDNSATSKKGDVPDAASRIREFRKKAMDLLQRESSYPATPSGQKSTEQDQEDDFDQSQMVLSLIGHAPQERRLFSSLPASHDAGLPEVSLPVGVSMSRVLASSQQERAPTLGELFAPPKALPPLQPPKQPKTAAKGNTLDFYQPELTDKSPYRANSYFSQKLSSGHYLDYSHATPTASARARHHERVQSLAGKKPSKPELEMSEMDALFRGAFSSFAPCKDDTSAVVSSSVAARVWWQKLGQQSFQDLVEVQYYDDKDGANGTSSEADSIELDEKALQEAIENWDDSLVDPTLDDAMGVKREDDEKEADDILDEVSDMIETLASYQRIRNLNLPNSQNRQSSDPVTGDMLATSGPQPSEEEQATYDMLKAQLALIIKTLPPYAIAKLNGDQLEDLLISTKVEVSTDQYRGIMEEDDAAVQARMRAQQQQQQQQQAAQANARPQQRTPSMSYANQYHTPQQQYGTPTRPPSQSQQMFRPGVTPGYPQNYQQQQQQRQFPPSGHQARPPQPNQYSRPNGYAAQYATQLAKAQTPFGHQNMPQYANQQRQQFGQMPQQGTPNARYPYQQQGHQQPGTPTQHYQQYTNGSGMQQQQQQRMSPQVPQRQVYSPSPNMQHNQQRYGTPTQGMTGQANRYPGNQPQTNSSLGYHTVIPEAQQQRILEQAKARVAAQERSAMFTDKISSPGGLAGMGLDASRLAAARNSMGGQQKPGTPTGNRPNGTPGPAHVPPSKITPVPVPVIPGQQSGGSSTPTPTPQTQPQQAQQ